MLDHRPDLSLPSSERPVSDLRQLTRGFPLPGRVVSLFLRPARTEPAVPVDWTEAIVERGLRGDRASMKPPGPRGGGKRQVSLMQAEHLPLIAGWLSRDSMDPAVLRRNIVIAGLNLIAARPLFADQPVRLRIGAEALFEVTGPCDPCSKMEARLGPGAYNAMRGHGGMTARVIASGRISIGDAVRVEFPTGDEPT